MIHVYHVHVTSSTIPYVLKVPCLQSDVPSGPWLSTPVRWLHNLSNWAVYNKKMHSNGLSDYIKSCDRPDFLISQVGGGYIRSAVLKMDFLWTWIALPKYGILAITNIGISAYRQKYMSYRHALTLQVHSNLDWEWQRPIFCDTCLTHLSIWYYNVPDSYCRFGVSLHASQKAKS